MLARGIETVTLDDAQGLFVLCNLCFCECRISRIGLSEMRPQAIEREM